MLEITNQVQLQMFFESRKGFGFPNSFRKTVPDTRISKARSPILVLVLRTETSNDFDDHSRDLLQSVDSWLILSNQIINLILILITAVLYSAPSRKSTQERSKPNLGQNKLMHCCSGIFAPGWKV